MYLDIEKSQNFISYYPAVTFSSSLVLERHFFMAVLVSQYPHLTFPAEKALIYHCTLLVLEEDSSLLLLSLSPLFLFYCFLKFSLSLLLNAQRCHCTIIISPRSATLEQKKLS